MFRAIGRAASPGALFDLLVGHFTDKGFGGVCYVAPPSPTGAYLLFHRGMPADWMARYEAHALHRFDPIPGMALRIGQAQQISSIVGQLRGLSSDEQAFINAFRESGLGEGLAIPAFGPFGRPGFVGLTRPRHGDVLRELDLPLASAVAQQVHQRMALLQGSEPLPALSPREREILRWMSRGKSNSDIAAILSITAPTVNTHVQRIYAKMRVHDRVTCIAKALAFHYV